MDELDVLTLRQEQEEEFARRDRAAKETRVSASPIPTFCQDCGDALPTVRQQYRCLRCTDCQELAERQARFFRRLI